MKNFTRNVYPFWIESTEWGGVQIQYNIDHPVIVGEDLIDAVSKYEKYIRNQIQELENQSVLLKRIVNEKKINL